MFSLTKTQSQLTIKNQKFFCSMQRIYLPILKVASKAICRRNPGPAAVGYLIYGNNKQSPLLYDSEFLGDNLTNNLAEYTGLKKALAFAVEHYDSEKLMIILNSQTVVRQLMRVYSISSPDLDEVAQEIWEFENRFDSVECRFSPKEFPWVSKARSLAEKELSSVLGS